MVEKILVAMSGGVDSSSTAAMLVDQGHEVIGARMRVRDPRPVPAAEGEAPCCSSRDLDDARAVAKRLGIPFYEVDLREPFEEHVVTPFVHSYLEGRTPNPCVACNPRMKFGLLLEKAAELGCEAIATGHYVKVERRQSGRWGLRRGDERQREQSYYLHRLNQDQLSRFRAPLGTWQKADVRRYAQQRGLPVATKEGSQEICFIPDDDYRSFVREHPVGRKTLIEPGDIVDRKGRVLGRHDGIVNYTIGQRRGLGIAHPHPLYVIEIDPENNRVVVGEKKDVLGSELTVADTNWVSIPRPDEPIEARVQIRYRSQAEPARVEPLDDGRIRIVFEKPQPAITPGQAAVFYDTNNVWLLGGGWIEKSAASP